MSGYSESAESESVLAATVDLLIVHVSQNRFWCCSQNELSKLGDATRAQKMSRFCQLTALKRVEATLVRNKQDQGPAGLVPLHKTDSL